MTKRNILFLFLLGFFWAAPAVADVGNPDEKALAHITLQNGTRLDALVPVTGGGYAEKNMPAQFDLTYRDDKVVTQTMDTSRETQTIVFDWSKLKTAEMRLGSARNFNNISVNIEIKCGQPTMRDLPLKDVARMTLDYAATRKDREAVLQKFDIGRHRECLRFFDGEGAGDGSCTGFFNPGVDNEKLAHSILQAFYAMQSGGDIAAQIIFDAPSLGKSPEDIREVGLKLISAAEMQRKQSHMDRISEDITARIQPLLKRWNVTQECGAFSVEEELVK